MKYIIEIAPLENGAHNNQSWLDTLGLPDGWAVMEMAELPKNFPFGTPTVETVDGMPTVTAWAPMKMPEPEPEPPSEMDVLQAQVTYTALKAGTLIGGA